MERDVHNGPAEEGGGGGVHGVARRHHPARRLRRQLLHQPRPSHRQGGPAAARPLGEFRVGLVIPMYRQGDPSGLLLGFVDIKTKNILQYRLLILKCNFEYEVNKG